MEKHKKPPKPASDFNATKDFLLSAISNLSNTINLIDNKISIIMVTTGVVLGFAFTCKSNVLKAYNYYSYNCILKALFLQLSFSYIISTFITFIFGIQCIMIRFGKSKHPSLWFFKTEEFDGISEQAYSHKVIQATREDLKKNLSAEVYTLNAINNRKMRFGKLTIIFFSISFFMFIALMIMIGIAYLMV